MILARLGYTLHSCRVINIDHARFSIKEPSGNRQKSLSSFHLASTAGSLFARAYFRKEININISSEGGGSDRDTGNHEEGKSDEFGSINDNGGSARRAAGKAAKSWR